MLMNYDLSPERTINISLLIAAHFVPVMVHVPLFPFGSRVERTCGLPATTTQLL